MNYESAIERESSICPGVRYKIARSSYARRIELMRRVRDAVARLRFEEAGTDQLEDQADAAVSSAEIGVEYLRWGLVGLSGLNIDGEEATPEMLIEQGPEDLAAEALEHVIAATGLSEEETKNFGSHSISTKSSTPTGNATAVGEPAWRERETAAG